MSLALSKKISNLDHALRLGQLIDLNNQMTDTVPGYRKLMHVPQGHRRTLAPTRNLWRNPAGQIIRQVKVDR